MAAVLEFRCDSRRARRKPPSLHESASHPAPAGEVVIFPGIRVERPQEPQRPTPREAEATDHEI